MSDLTAQDIMNREVYSVPEAWTLRELVPFLSEKSISGAPVVDAEGRLTGFVTMRDVAEFLVSGTDAPRPERRRLREDIEPDQLSRLQIQEEGAQVRDVMTPVAYTVAEDVSVKDLARTMIAGRIHRLVVARGSRIVGIVSTLDLLRVVAEG
jgi:CBS domain-containing protein